MPRLFLVRLPCFGPQPDGLLCMENGDILVAAFRHGEILYIPLHNSVYGDPIVVAKDMDNPTDLALGRGACGEGESLFVTTTKLSRAFFPSRWKWGRGRVIEIENIREKLKDIKEQNA